jgi:uncharacterized protein affecting Mg2+/Co2+ transport
MRLEMTKFVTIASDAKSNPVLLWSDDNGKAKVVSRHGSLDAVPVHADLEVFQFDVPTSLGFQTGVNSGKYPVVGHFGYATH